MRVRGHIFILSLAMIIGLIGAQPAFARETLGIYHSWGAFRDEAPPRCFAIARPSSAMPGREWKPFISIGFYPLQKIYGQLHVRLRFNVRPDSRITATIDQRRFALVGRGSDAWASNTMQDVAIIQSMRSGRSVSIEAVSSTGQAFADSYRLRGAASAIDAAAISCKD